MEHRRGPLNPILESELVVLLLRSNIDRAHQHAIVNDFRNGAVVFERCGDALLLGAGTALLARSTAEVSCHLIRHRVKFNLALLQICFLLVFGPTCLAVRHYFIEHFGKVDDGGRLLEVARIDCFLVTLREGLSAGFSSRFIFVVAAVGQD